MKNKNKFGFCILIVFLISLTAASAQNNNHIKVSGYMEVVRADFEEDKKSEFLPSDAENFEKSNESRIRFFLNADGKKYELIPNKQMKAYNSDTLVEVEGNLYGNKIIVDRLAIKQTAANSAPALSLGEQKVLTQSNAQDTTNTPSNFKLNWFYVAAPGLLIVLFLGYIEIKRVKEHKGLIFNYKQQKNLALRNYVAANLRKGFGKGQIRNALVKSNYNSKEIEEAFRVIR